MKKALIHSINIKHIDWQLHNIDMCSKAQLHKLSLKKLQDIYTQTLEYKIFPFMFHLPLEIKHIIYHFGHKVELKQILERICIILNHKPSVCYYTAIHGFQYPKKATVRSLYRLLNFYPKSKWIFIPSCALGVPFGSFLHAFTSDETDDLKNLFENAFVLKNFIIVK